jgi:hypothetical protein
VGLGSRDRRLDRVPPRPCLGTAPVGLQPATERGAVHEGPLPPYDPLRVRPWRGRRAADDPRRAERHSKRQKRRKHQDGQEPHSVECDTREWGLPRGESSTVSRVAGLHLGLILPNYGDVLDAERWRRPLLRPREAGFDSGWVTDHVVVPAEHATVYGTIAEPLVTLGFLAGRTRTLELGVSALVRAGARPGRDERGRHAIAGPPEWIAERVAEYAHGGCNGFVEVRPRLN